MEAKNIDLGVNLELNKMISKEIAIFYKPILCKNELSKLLGKSVKTIDTWIREDEIPYRKVKSTTYFIREEIMQWMDSCA